jgi:radical SAM protein with 4Fe4S-binding SPASM domain
MRQGSMRLNAGPDKYLLCNQFSGAVTLVDAQWWRQLGLDDLVYHANTDHFTLVPDAAEYARALVTRGLASIDEATQLQEDHYILTEHGKAASDENIHRFAQLKRQTRVTMAYFTPTISCPMSCVYCFENHPLRPTSKALLAATDIPSIETFLAKYCERRDVAPGHLSLVLFGGEPLIASLRPFNTALFALARRRGYSLDIVTSASSIDSQYLRLLNDHRDILREIDVTIDGPESTHDVLRPWKNGGPTYKTIVRNVDLLLANHHRVMVKTNFGRSTLEVVDQLLDSFRSYGWFDSPNFLFTTNLVRSFGATDTKGQELPEETSILKIIELFQSERYSALLPRVRIESLKITDYLSNALRALTHTSPTGIAQNQFDAYPKYAFCHPDDGTMFNIGYDGGLYTCNWASGKRHLSVGNLFDSSADRFCDATSEEQAVVERAYCKNCDLNTFCGGGCPIDRTDQSLNAFHADCRRRLYQTLQHYVDGALTRGLVDLSLRDSRLRTYRNGFDYGYRYEGRIARQQLRFD